MSYPSCADFPLWYFVRQRRARRDAEERGQVLEHQLAGAGQRQETAGEHVRNAIQIMTGFRQSNEDPTHAEELATSQAVLIRLHAALHALQEGRP